MSVSAANVDACLPRQRRRQACPPEAASTVRALLEAGARYLDRCGPAQARHEVAWVLGRLLKVSRPELHLIERPVPEEAVQRFWRVLERRIHGAPLQYLLGETEFCGAVLAVGPGVFIPRPETETVVEAALEAFRGLAVRRRRPLRLLDLGTGSGCIAVTLGRCLPACFVVGVELSWSALRVARKNVLRHGLASRVRLVQGCWLQALRGTYDGIISNPPYIPRPQIDTLPLEVRREPRVSLDGGPDGLEALRHLLAQAEGALRPGGVLVLECGEAQVSPLMQAARQAPWIGQVVALRDLSRRPRGILAHRTDHSIDG